MQCKLKINCTKLRTIAQWDGTTDYQLICNISKQTRLLWKETKKPNFTKFIGGLYAGATAGGNVKAEAGLAGRVASEDVAGNGFATAQAGGHNAVSGLVRSKEERRKRKELKKLLKNQKHL